MDYNSENDQDNNKSLHDAEPPFFYMEEGLCVFTETYHLQRGYCCGNSCRHCPWKEDKKESL
jgi:hypothetical protein